MAKNKKFTILNVCIIPARGGSKRIPRKNVLPLNGRPLICYSILAAKESGLFDEIVVSTEDQEIKTVALEYGVKVDDRPEYLAGDTVTKVEVIREFLSRESNKHKYRFITALLPTCPFRTALHLKEAYSIFVNHPEIPFLIGVTEYDFPIQLALSPVSEHTVEITFENGYSITRSQDIEKRYHPNGAMYMATVEAFLSNGTFFNQKMHFYKMSALHSFDIDYPYQFEIAEILSKKPEIF